MPNLGPVLIGAGAVALLASSKKSGGGRTRFGVQVTKDCEVDIVNEDKYLTFLRAGYLEEKADNPGYGPFEMAEALFKDVAPHCHYYPEQPESMDVFRLYLNILGHVSNFMVDDGTVKPAQILELREDSKFAEWSEFNEKHLGRKWGHLPEDQVNFAKDYSEYRIGPLWEEDNLAPFVIAAKNEGLSNQEIYDDFAAKRNVLVGEAEFVRIADLPENTPAVQEFLDRIIKGIEAAE